ncbi:transglutaminase-like domain-containing protein [Roseivirga misakiensis]|uniref:Transglutaminase-like domain-containing protein n=1 Tax=Roseivirga misakiensis TaxID=1563681 RepID=A0A1E5SKP6_9BACT|nr:transglutaminase-like domain-containing protein [Roseivirga misakiensis]OEJ99699.1 hypothetical protein BFP71_09010 [Roseivirga misakiensis]
MIVRKLGLLIILLFSTVNKDPLEELEALRASYPDETVVITKRYQNYDIKIVGDSLKINVSHTEEMAFLGDQVGPYAKDQIYTSSFYTAENIKAATLTPGRRKWERNAVEDFRTVADDDNSVFYDDSEYITFTYPGVKKNTKSLLTYDAKINDPHFLGSDYFASYIPIIDVKYTFTVDEGVKLKHYFFNIDSSEVSQTTTKSPEGRNIYTFQLKNVPKVNFEPSSLAFNYRASHMSSLIESYVDTNGKTVEVLGDTDDLYRWYWTFIEGLKEENGEEVKRILADILSPNDDELTKVKKVFYWVQKNIKYIAFEDGMRGFVPHNGDYVCTKRYGDCKDMASIIVNMLYHAGIDAHYTWIGTRDLPYKYTELPTASVDNHMIATYINGNDYYYLDATGQYQPFGLPTSMIQGKEALIAIDKDNYEIKTVPIIEKENNTHEDTFSYKIENGKVVGSGELSLKGYAKVFNTYRLINSTKKSTDEYLNRALNRGNNKFFIDDYEISGLNDFDTPIKVNYEFRVEDYYREINDAIYFNMNLDKAFSNATIEKNRENAFEGEYKYINKSTSTLEIPEGYQVSRMPKDYELKGKNFGFTMAYSQNKNTISLKRDFYVDYLMMGPKEFEDWNDAIQKFTKETKQIVILKKQ